MKEHDDTAIADAILVLARELSVLNPMSGADARDIFRSSVRRADYPQSPLTVADALFDISSAIGDVAAALHRISDNMSGG